MSLPPPIVYDPDIHLHLLPQLVQIHADCVLQDGTIATFHPDANGQIDHDRLLKYWTSRSEDVSRGSRAIILQFASASSERVVLAGHVTLAMTFSDTGPFRVIVEKLLVSPQHRYQGIARRLMAKLEDVARERDHELIMLDTVIGSGAEFVYAKLGYKEVGIVPKYSIDPKDGRLRDEIWFYKDLRTHES